MSTLVVQRSSSVLVAKVPHPWSLPHHLGSGISNHKADASKQFWKYHNEGVLKKYSPKLKIGDLKEDAKL